MLKRIKIHQTLLGLILPQSCRVPSRSRIPSSVKRPIVLMNIEHDRYCNRTTVRPDLMTATGKLCPYIFAYTVADGQRTRLSEGL